ncbi:hypothetical protein K450DRAFT_233185 [Umbelopsis ramanniana AG]|uniref:Uncharacterized protein n=1 Tax=Umbelopsis ramanniana AG TaxID=1314678 RepID=A0AAD5EDQ0_UMBRA|nr:uncharacterized protein K450DRAFT_233185 [Umbelopsis ramanniana AG]KAI8581120.1 hypothetical protein K450DRAFT_233185 [Umbelopsis ramanniana AG]
MPSRSFLTRVLPPFSAKFFVKLRNMRLFPSEEGIVRVLSQSMAVRSRMSRYSKSP